MADNNHYYGWIKDSRDPRDFLFAKVHAPAEAIPLPPKISLLYKFEPVYNQMELGSCMAQSTIAAFTFEHGGGPWSRLEQYYEARLLEGTADQDSGAMIRDGIKVLATVGVGLEADWPYDIRKFAEAPPEKIIGESAQNKIITYSRLSTRDDFRQCLAAGFPFVVGIQLYDSFESGATAASGIVKMPDLMHENYLGGHAVCVVGYNTNIHGGDYYEVRNSWGDDWGDKGYFWIPAAYLEDANLASDCWTIRH